MGSVIVKSLAFLLMFALIMPSAVDGRRPMHMKNKYGEPEDYEHSRKRSTYKHDNLDGTVIGEEGQVHSSKSSTYKHDNQEGTVIGGEDHEHSSTNSTYKDFHQDDTEPRSLPKFTEFVSRIPGPCFLNFLIGQLQPTGFRTGQALQRMWYVCPMVNQVPYYGTMFDGEFGIPTWAAYIVTNQNVNFVSHSETVHWRQTQGILTQGSDAIYEHGGYHRGHTVPRAIYSVPLLRLLSTYVYTNAVPQTPAFNTGQWRQFEGRIRAYAQQCVLQNGGILYLLTGTALGHIQNNPSRYNPDVPINYLGPAGNAIVVPNSMWTAGCCVLPNGNVQCFAVMGNNVQDTTQMFTQQLTVQQLQNHLSLDGVFRNIGENVVLFPGNRGASDEKNNINLPPKPPPKG